MTYTDDHTGLNYYADSISFWSKEDHESYDYNLDSATWLDKEERVFGWCIGHHSRGQFSYCVTTGRFYFEYEQDLLWALLRWS
jgi:hypothetical protein